MRNQKRRSVRGLQSLKQDVHLVSSEGVKRTEWLVQKQERRISQKSAGNRHPLTHASRKLPRIRFCKPSDIELPQKLSGTRLKSSQPFDLGGQHHIAQYVPPLKQKIALKHYAHVGDRPGDWHCPDAYRASRRRI